MRAKPTMTEPRLQPEHAADADITRIPAIEILEIRNITLKAALKIVRELIAREDSPEHK
jgi:hypothetical protein